MVVNKTDYENPIIIAMYNSNENIGKNVFEPSEISVDICEWKFWVVFSDCFDTLFSTSIRDVIYISIS